MKRILLILPLFLGSLSCGGDDSGDPAAPGEGTGTAQAGQPAGAQPAQPGAQKPKGGQKGQKPKGGQQAQGGQAAKPPGNGGGAQGAGEQKIVPTKEERLAVKARIKELSERPELELDKLKIQHVLISFEGAKNSKTKRTQEEAEELAIVIYSQVASGSVEFADAMRYSNDTGEGQYVSANSGQTDEEGVFARKQLAANLGNVSWRLEVGEVGVVPYDQFKAPYGFHVVKRIE